MSNADKVTLKNFQFDFNKQKTTSFLLVLASIYFDREPITQLSRHRAMYLCYILDKTSLELLGHSVTGATYYASKNGPTSNQLLEVIGSTDLQNRYEYYIHADQSDYLRETSFQGLSYLERPVIERVIGIYGYYPTWHLRELASDEAWKYAYDNPVEIKTKIGEGMRVDIQRKMSITRIVQLLENEDELLQKIFETIQKKNGDYTEPISEAIS